MKLFWLILLAFFCLFLVQTFFTPIFHVRKTRFRKEKHREIDFIKVESRWIPQGPFEEQTISPTPAPIDPPPRSRRDTIVSKYHDFPNVGLRGLMSSGTNWLRFLIRENCPGSIFPLKHPVDWDAIYGWKHGLLEDEEIERMLRNDQHKMIFMTRNPIEWSHAMRRMANMQHEVGNPLWSARFSPMETFLNTKFVHPCPKAYEWYYPNCHNNNMITTDNIIEWREMLYLQFIALAEKFPDKFMVVRYEDLRDHLFDTWQRIAAFAPETMQCDANLTIKSVFRVKFGKKTNEVFNKNKTIHEACDDFPKYLYSFLNWELEQQFDYDKKVCF